MTYRSLSAAQVLGDTARFESFETLIAHLEAITTPAHNADGHQFEDDPDKPGVCRTCGWVHPDVPARCCGRPVRDHLLSVTEKVKAIRDGEMFPGIEIEVTIVEIARPRRRGFWPFN